MILRYGIGVVVNDLLGLMSAKTFIERQLLQIRQGRRAVLFRKMKQVLQIVPKLPEYIFTVPFAVPVVLVLRLIRPFLLVRWGVLESSRIGHFAANTELYLCEQERSNNCSFNT